MSPPENEKMPLSSLEAIADALLEIMEVRAFCVCVHACLHLVFDAV